MVQSHHESATVPLALNTTTCKNFSVISTLETKFAPYNIWSLSSFAITVFARSDAAATIYFITQFCAASNREQCLLNSVISVKSQFYKINKEYMMRWLGFEANLPASWSAAALLQSDTYTAPPIRFLVFFQLLHTLIAFRASTNAKLLRTALYYCTYRVYYLHVKFMVAHKCTPLRNILRTQSDSDMKRQQ